MSVAERKKTAEFTVRYVNGRVPVLIGTGGTNTREVIELSRHAEQAGADGIVVINPYYWVLTEENLYKHYSEIAEAVKLPLLLYNFPNMTGQDLTPDFVLRLVDQHANVVGIKETIDSIGHISGMITKVKSKHPDFAVFCGFDNHLLNTLQMGGDGSITASVNFAPQLSVGIYQAFRKGDLAEAGELQKRLSLLPNIYNIDSPFVNAVKEATKLCGLDVSTDVLPPSRPLSLDKIEQVRSILEQAKVLPAQL